jgi:hypothetical protein
MFCFLFLSVCFFLNVVLFNQRINKSFMILILIHVQELVSSINRIINNKLEIIFFQEGYSSKCKRYKSEFYTQMKACQRQDLGV